MTLLKHTLQQDDLITILVMIYTFVDNFIKQILQSIFPAIERPGKNHPPLKTYNLNVAELVSLAIFRFFIGYRNWKDFYKFIKTYHTQDFPNLPTYGNFLKAMNKLSSLATILLQGFMNVFQKMTVKEKLKFADGSRLRVCEIKREFSHKVCFGLASKSKSTMGWFYGFKLHIICNELMQILNLKITTATFDERKALEMMWGNIFGTIVADAGYVGKKYQEKARKNGKILFTCVRANMKKIMTETEHQVFKLRQKVETVFSVLKLRLGLETTLPRSPKGFFAHYLWCITAYQMKKFFECVSAKALLA